MNSTEENKTQPASDNGDDSDFLDDDTEGLTFRDLLGFLDEVNVSSALRKRSEQWAADLRNQKLKMDRQMKSAKKQLAGLRNGLRNGLKQRGKAVRKMITGNEDYPVTEMIRDTSKRTARRFITGDSNKAVHDYIHEPPVVRTIDCISFTVGVLLLVSAEFMAIRFPKHFWIYYLFTAWVMMVSRIVLWWGGVYKYFLADFCYFVNYSISLVILFFPRNSSLLQICFVWANGPVGLATITWRNSLVFHSLEKVTSLYIHAAPPLLMLCIRWYSGDNPAICGEDGCTLSLQNWWGYPFLGYMVWQVLQLILTEVVGNTEIHERDLQTSCRWIATHPRMPIHTISLGAARALGVMSKEEGFQHETLKTKIIFVVFQGIYTFLTMLPCKILFESFWAHMAYLSILFIQVLWNGAKYYIHIFAERYAQKFKVSPDGPTAKVTKSRASKPHSN